MPLLIVPEQQPVQCNAGLTWFTPRNVSSLHPIRGESIRCMKPGRVATQHRWKAGQEGQVGVEQVNGNN